MGMKAFIDVILQQIRAFLGHNRFSDASCPLSWGVITFPAARSWTALFETEVFVETEVFASLGDCVGIRESLLHALPIPLASGARQARVASQPLERRPSLGIVLAVAVEPILEHLGRRDVPQLPLHQQA